MFEFAKSNGHKCFSGFYFDNPTNNLKMAVKIDLLFETDVCFQSSLSLSLSQDKGR